MKEDGQQAFARWVHQAQAHTRELAWQAAAEAWVAAAAVAEKAGAVDAARQALGAAGETYRRDDRPRPARACLERALALGAPPAEAAMIGARLAGVLGEMGEGRAALGACPPGPDEGPTQALCLDTRIGVLLGYGRKADVRPLVDALEQAEGADGVARWFRRGQLQRLDGELEAAVSSFDGVARRLAGVEGAEAGVAAAAMEIGEVRALQGDPGPAIDAFGRGAVLHRAAGRLGSAWRCEAARVRAAVEAGAEVLPGTLDPGIAVAEARGMALLSLDLHIARGMADAERDPVQASRDLEEGVERADRWRCRLRAGRARLQLATQLAPPQRRRELLERAAADLADHVPLHERALAALGVSE